MTAPTDGTSPATPGQGGAAVHLFIPMLHRHDASGRHTLVIRDLLRRRGVASEIFVELDDPETAAVTRPAAGYPAVARPTDVLVYQMATSSDLAPWLAARSEALVVNYHNITPPRLFEAWDNGLARHQVSAHHQLGQLAARAVLGVAVSEFNRADLVAAGFRRTEVVPLVTGPGAPEPGAPEPGAPGTESHGPAAADDRRAERPAGPARWLVVGRVAPNKAVEDVLDALLYFRAAFDPGAVLEVVGKAAVASYADALVRWSADLGLADAVRFRGAVSDDELAAAYREADVLVVLSEHEGFCLPAVEAMRVGLPVVAYREGALPEVLGDAGVLLEDKDAATVADAVNRLLSDPGQRAATAAAGRRQLARLDLASAGPRMVDLLLSLSRPPAGPRAQAATAS